MRRADQHGPALGPQPARRAGLRDGAVRALDAADRAGRARDRRHGGRHGRGSGDGRRRVPRRLDRVLLPKPRRTKPDAVPVLDNLGAHKTPEVRDLLDRSGFAYRYLPAYSPDMNPIEPAWAKMKAELRRVGARTAEALHQALGPALDAITAQNAAACFQHCGYGRPR